MLISLQAAGLESRASEAEAASEELRERLGEALRQAERAEADTETAKSSAAEAQVGGDGDENDDDVGVGGLDGGDCLGLMAFYSSSFC